MLVDVVASRFHIYRVQRFTRRAVVESSVGWSIQNLVRATTALDVYVGLLLLLVVAVVVVELV